MKKTIIALLALAGVAAAETLTLNVTELKSSNTLLTWSDDIDALTSWALTFNLDSQRAALAEQDLAFIQNDGSNNNAAVKFSVNTNGTLEFYGYGASTISPESMVTVDSTPITLQFIANEQAGSIIGGRLTAISGEKSFSIDLDSDLTLTTSNSIRLWSNGGNEHFTNITLSALSNNVVAVPEPTTATLSLLALAGLAARRRRK
ncbi:MAG: PEP-CTERM sorting domain-containing protein [Akkermansiaceae bacterium]|nr:PEP-CTERM sorting domain-containing protein [Akkermansiaceae bacterium]